MELTDSYTQIVTGGSFVTLQPVGDVYVSYTGGANTGFYLESGEIFEIDLSRYTGNLFARAAQDRGARLYHEAA